MHRHRLFVRMLISLVLLLTASTTWAEDVSTWDHAVVGNKSYGSNEAIGNISGTNCTLEGPIRSSKAAQQKNRNFEIKEGNTLTIKAASGYRIRKVEFWEDIYGVDKTTVTASGYTVHKKDDKYKINSKDALIIENYDAPLTQVSVKAGSKDDFGWEHMRITVVKEAPVMGSQYEVTCLSTKNTSFAGNSNVDATYSNVNNSYITISNHVIKGVKGGSTSFNVQVNANATYAKGTQQTVKVTVNRIACSISVNTGIFASSWEATKIYTHKFTDSVGRTVKVDNLSFDILSISHDNGYFYFYCKKNGTAKFKYYADETDIYAKTEVTIEIPVNRTTTSPSYSSTTVTANVVDGANFTEPTLDKNSHDGIVTYSASPEARASVDKDGNVTLNDYEPGTVTITASFAESDVYKAASCSYTITTTRKTVTPAFTSTTATAWVGETDFTEPTLNANSHNGKMTYSSSPKDRAEVDGDGNVTLKDYAPGEVTITASFPQTNKYEAASCSYTITTTRTTVTPAFAETSKTAWTGAGTDFDEPVLKNNNHDGTLTYSSNNENVAKVNATTGAVQIIANAPGEAIITASFATSNKYEAKTCSYTITTVKTAHEALADQSVTLLNGESVQLQPDAWAQTAGTPTYTLEDGAPGTITAKGVLTMKKRGAYQATITYPATNLYDALTQKVNINVLNIHYTDSNDVTHGTLTVTRNGEPLVHGDELMLGDVIKYQLTPDKGYYFADDVITTKEVTITKDVLNPSRDLSNYTLSGDAVNSVTKDNPLVRGDYKSTTGFTIQMQSHYVIAGTRTVTMSYPGFGKQKISFDWNINQDFIQYGRFKLNFYVNGELKATRDFTETPCPSTTIYTEEVEFEGIGENTFKWVFEKGVSDWADDGRWVYVGNFSWRDYAYISEFQAVAQNQAVLKIPKFEHGTMTVKRNGVTLADGEYLKPGDVLNYSYQMDEGYDIVDALTQEPVTQDRIEDLKNIQLTAADGQTALSADNPLKYTDYTSTDGLIFKMPTTGQYSDSNFDRGSRTITTTFEHTGQGIITFDWQVSSIFIEWGLFKLHFYVNGEEKVTRDFKDVAPGEETIYRDTVIFNGIGNNELKWDFEKYDTYWGDNEGRTAYLGNVKAGRSLESVFIPATPQVKKLLSKAYVLQDRGYGDGDEKVEVPFYYVDKAKNQIGIGKTYGADIILENKITIPSEITEDGETYTVTEIGDDAFMAQAYIDEMIIPSTVTKIGNDAFYLIYYLKNITIMGYVSEIGYGVFNQCPNVETMTITTPFAQKCEEYGWNKITNKQQMKYVVEVGSTGYATLTPSKSFDFSKSTAKAYVATSYDDVEGTLHVSRTNLVTAGTGVLIKAEPGIHEVKLVDEDAFIANLFVGNLKEDFTLYPYDGDYTNFILSYQNGVVGFYPVAQPGAFAIGKAYLSLALSGENYAKAYRFVFDDSTSKVDGVSSRPDGEDGHYYNLQGQRVEHPHHGVFIKNGKKVIVK